MVRSHLNKFSKGGEELKKTPNASLWLPHVHTPACSRVCMDAHAHMHEHTHNLDVHIQKQNFLNEREGNISEPKELCSGQHYPGP